jgi:hypothetical protein
MQILFVDESGTPPQNNQKAHKTPFFVLGSIVIPEDIWEKCANQLATIKKNYSVAGEIKWRYFAPNPGGKPNSLSHLNAEEKELLRTDLYKLISSYRSMRLICIVTNTVEAFKLDYINSSEDIYWYSYKQLTERFQYYLQDMGREVGQKLNGIVVLDNRGPEDDKKIRELHHKLLTKPTQKTAFYQNLLEGLFIAPSHLSVGIQLADMVAGAVFRSFMTKDDRFINQIEGSFRRSRKGTIVGYGLVKFPKGNW